MIKYIMIDVDGTMTDAGIYYDNAGNELKKFCTRDAAGFFVAQKLGVKIIVVTGRECPATEKRMHELKVQYLYQGISNKMEFLQSFMQDQNISADEVMYIGDDLNDYEAMKLVGYVACPIDSCKEIKNIADYISTVQGGKGAVRDIVEHYFSELGEWEKAIKEIYNIGV